MALERSVACSGKATTAGAPTCRSRVYPAARSALWFASNDNASGYGNTHVIQFPRALHHDIRFL
jgi:hypothetical protein